MDLSIAAGPVQSFISVEFPPVCIPVVIALVLDHAMEKLSNCANQHFLSGVSLYAGRLMEMVEDTLNLGIRNESEPFQFELTHFLQWSVLEAVDKLRFVFSFIRSDACPFGVLPQNSVRGQNGL